jgi:ribosomal-protein-alanine N-acetyltransferase
MPDAAGLAAIHAACFTHPRPWTASEIASILSSPLAFVLADSGGFLLGRVVADEAELLTLAVLPDQRRRGVATALVQDFLTTAHQRAAAHAFLEVAANNQPALALYLGAGFALVGRRAGYYRTAGGAPDDALVLSRAL